MRNLLIYFPLILFTILSSCQEDEKTTINEDLLYGDWKLTEHTINNTSYNKYLIIFEVVDIDTHSTMWTDTIRFDNTVFSFGVCGDPCIINFNPFNLLSDNVRDLNGGWGFDNSDYSVTLGSIANQYMQEDTLINGHRYSYDALISGYKYNIVALDGIHLKLTVDNQVIEFERIN